MYLLYSAALAAAAALTFPYFAIQGLRHGKYWRSFRARWGGVAPAGAADAGEAASPGEAAGGTGAIWLHAVSVGEVLACPRLVNELRARMPGRRILVSTTTETGLETARRRLAADGFFYCPYDFAFTVRRVLKRVRPAMLVVAETELWPNLFREARKSGARVALVNARVSDRSFPRYRMARALFRQVLADADLLLAQSSEDARRLTEIGGANVQVSTPLKYDQVEPAALPAWLHSELERWSAPGVLVAGSTAAGEEEHLLRAWKGRMILAPRRPERFDAVSAMAPTQRLSALREGAQITSDILLLDTVGELASIYRYAKVTFVGGSLVDHGGQNPLEPAWFGKPIVVGPSMTNFRDITAKLLAADAIRQVRSASELPAALQETSRDSAMGERARAVLDANRGSAAFTADALARLLASGDAVGAAARGGRA